jgi:hypothetical protein
MDFTPEPLGRAGSFPKKGKNGTLFAVMAPQICRLVQKKEERA